MDHQALQHTLEALPAVQLAVLFGSRATARGRSESDVDLGVILEPNSSTSRGEVLVATGRAVERDIDLVDLTVAPPLLRFQIARHGTLLVERKPRLWVDFKTRAMIDWWDWAPVARRHHEIALRRLRQRAAGED